MSDIFYNLPAPNPKTPISLVNVQTLGACCGTFESHEAAEKWLRDNGYSEKDYFRHNDEVCYYGGVNC